MRARSAAQRIGRTSRTASARRATVESERAVRVWQRATTEEELLLAVTEAMSFFGWRWTHTRRSDKALTMGDPGVPDIIAARHPRVLFVELKSETGKLTTEQMAWVLAIAGQKPDERLPGHPQIYVWRPSDLDRAIETLR